MTEFIKKTTKIIDTVVIFFMAKKCGTIDIKIENNNDMIKLIFDIEKANLYQDDLNDIRYSLNIPYQDDVDEYFWQLNGVNDKEVNFDLIGMMINSHEIEYQKGNLHLELIKHL